MKSIDARIARLETMFQGSPDDPFGLDRMTTDEKQVLLIFVSRKVAQDPETPAAERQECRETIAKIEADIQAMARQQASDHYAPHLERCRADWKRKSGKDNYVPALTWANGGWGEIFDWDMPDVMERRTELRALPEKRALLADGCP